MALLNIGWLMRQFDQSIYIFWLKDKPYSAHTEFPQSLKNLSLSNLFPW